jgi:hypothetical protein
MTHFTFDVLFVLTLFVPAAAVIIGALVLAVVPRRARRQHVVAHAIHA